MIEVFNAISQRIIRNVMLHEEMADYFDFLNLHGFKRQQEYHFFDESADLRGIHRYAINHCNRLITDTDIPSVKAIPQGWYNYTRLQVDAGTRKQAVHDAFEKWYSWEKETKEFYEKQFKILTDNGKIANANKVNELICKVDEELKYLTREMLEYKAVDYDMDYIMFKQNEIHECYKEKQKEIGINIC